MRIKSTQDLQSGERFFFHKPYDTYFGVRIGMSGINRARALLRLSSGSDINLYSSQDSIPVSQWIYLKISWDGSYYKIYTSDDGIEWLEEDSVQSSYALATFSNDTMIGATNAWSGANPFVGEIDLPNCYIKINNQLWWRGVTPATDGSVTVASGYHYNNETDAPFYLDSDLTRSATQMVVHSEDFVEQTVYIPQFEIVGSPTIADRVASGFSDSDYLTCTNYLNNASQSFELVTAVNMSTASTDNLGLFDAGTGGSVGLRLTTSSTNTVRLRISTGGTTTNAVDITGTTPLTVGTKVYIKVTYSSSTGYALYTSTDGSTWTTEGTSSTTTRPYTSAAAIRIGDNAATDLTLTGSIYLADSYIEVNGSRVWSGYEILTAKQGTLFLTKPTSTTTSTVVSANATPTATYVGSVVDQIDMGKVVTMDTTLTKILSVEDSA